MTGTRKTRVAIVHLLPAPYRIPLFERLLKDEELDIRLFFTERSSSERPLWSLSSLTSDSRIVLLPEVGVKSRKFPGEKIRFNMTLSRIIDWDPDVVLVYGHNDLTSLLTTFMCMWRGIPYVLFAEISNKKEWSLQRKLSYPLQRYLVQKASWLVPASSGAGSFYLFLGGRKETMTVIPCVPDIRRLEENADALRNRSSETRAKLDLRDKFVLLFVGRLYENKGIRELLEAMKRIHEADARVVLLILGTGPMEHEVKEKCERLDGAARHLGFVSDESLAELYAIADLHIMPSWDEPYGVVCAEALASGVPTVITRTSGCTDLVSDGVNGFIIDPRDPDQIQSAVLKVSRDSDLQHRLRANTRAVVDRYTMDDLYVMMKQVIMSAKRDHDE